MQKNSRDVKDKFSSKNKQRKKQLKWEYCLTHSGKHSI